MKLSKLLLLSVVVSALTCMVSCKEETPAEKLEGKAGEVEKKTESIHEKAIKQAEAVSGAKSE